MPTFSLGQSVMAKATLPVKPAGMACQAELYLGIGKVATSGKISFTSTGANQTINLPITMPSSGTYQVLLDITTDSLVIGSFYGTEDITIGTTGLSIVGSFGEIVILSIDGKGIGPNGLPTYPVMAEDGLSVLFKKSDLRTITITFLSKTTRERIGFALGLTASDIYGPGYVWVPLPVGPFIPPFKTLPGIAGNRVVDVGFTSGMLESGKVYTVTLTCPYGEWMRGVFNAHIYFGTYSEAYLPPISAIGMFDIPNLVEATQCGYAWETVSNSGQWFDNELTKDQVNAILIAYGYNPIP